MTTKTTSRLASGSETGIATDEQFAERLDRIKRRNGNNQPHADAENPYEQIQATELRAGDVLVRGVANERITVQQVQPVDGFILIWHSNTKVFSVERTTFLRIARRNGGA